MWMMNCSPLSPGSAAGRVQRLYEVISDAEAAVAPGRAAPLRRLLHAPVRHRGPSDRPGDGGPDADWHLLWRAAAIVRSFLAFVSLHFFPPIFLTSTMSSCAATKPARGSSSAWRSTALACWRIWPWGLLGRAGPGAFRAPWDAPRGKRSERRSSRRRCSGPSPAERWANLEPLQRWRQCEQRRRFSQGNTNE